jgi:hypothetical protein
METGGSALYELLEPSQTTPLGCLLLQTTVEGERVRDAVTVFCRPMPLS